MSPSGFRRRWMTLACLLVLSLGACTGGGDGTSSGPRGTGPTGTVSVAPGEVAYRYVNEGLVATMILSGTEGTLEIDNRTGRDLPKPSFYILDARDGHRIDGTVADAAAVPSGTSPTFDVSIGAADPHQIGLVVLLMGRDNYGAFVQQEG